MPFPTVHPALDRALAARGYAEPTSVQLAVIEADTAADLLVSAQTGSGKTVAFGLALASTLLGDADRFDRATRPLALIIAPTRELAMQIAREFEWLYADTGARIVQCVGGMSVRAEQGQLERGAHIVIGTPGRLCDHLDKGYLDLTELKAAVLDEADEMLDLGFREELETLLKATPEDRRTLLFSATIARGIAMLAKNYQRDAVRIDTTSATEPHGDIDYRAMRVSPGDTERAVVNVLRYFEAGRALVFCHTREAVRHLHASLRERGFHAVGLSGEMGQRERNDALQALRDGHAKVCVATDVAARGLDILGVDMVFNFDLPDDAENYVHRIGRTGRAGQTGQAFSMVGDRDVDALQRIEEYLKHKVEAVWMDDADLLTEMQPFPADESRRHGPPGKGGFGGRGERPRRDGDRRPSGGGGGGGRGPQRPRPNGPNAAGGGGGGQARADGPRRESHRDRNRGRHQGGDEQQQRQAGGGQGGGNPRRPNDNRNRPNGPRGGGGHSQQQRHGNGPRRPNGNPQAQQARSGNRPRIIPRVQKPPTIGQKVSGFIKNLFGKK
jgi:ATP-dependent RNA helicase DeaD